MSAAPDVARIRFDNAMRLFDEFVQATVKSPDAATLRGLERRFAERLQIQPSYWSQIKGRSRQIGERLARQFEQLCRKPVGWLDVDRSAMAEAGAVRQDAATLSLPPMSTQFAKATASAPGQPRDDDERFILGLVLTYYRRHPQRAKSRLLQLLGEVLDPVDGRDARPEVAPSERNKGRAVGPREADSRARSAIQEAPAPDDHALWLRLQAGVAPLKPRAPRK